MNEIDALVVAVVAEVALVKTGPRAAGCGRCNEPGGCGGGLLNLNEGAAVRHYRIANSIGAKAGDRVLICAPDGSVLRVALISYGIPLLLALLGAALGTWLDGRDIFALCGAMVGIALAVGLLRSGLLRQWEPNLSLRFKSDDPCLQRTTIS